MNACGDCVMLLQVGWALGWVPPGHCWSRAADHMDSHARCLLAAKATSCWALAMVKISSLVSLTPIMGVTAILGQAAASLMPRTVATWASVAVAASMAKVPMLPAGLGAAPSP